MTKYTDFILTVIAILLALHLVKPLFISTNVNAAAGVVDINIAEINGKTLRTYKLYRYRGIPVEVTNTVNVEGEVEVR